MTPIIRRAGRRRWLHRNPREQRVETLMARSTRILGSVSLGRAEAQGHSSIMMRERIGEFSSGIEWMESLPRSTSMRGPRMGQFACSLEAVSQLAREHLALIHSEFTGLGSVKNRRSRDTPAIRVFSCLVMRAFLGLFEPEQIRDLLVCCFLPFQRGRKLLILLSKLYERTWNWKYFSIQDPMIQKHAARPTDSNFIVELISRD